MTTSRGTVMPRPAVPEMPKAHAGASVEGCPARPVQPPLFNLGPSIWDRAHHAATLREISHALAPNIGWELTAEHGWRLVTIPAATRRALQALDIAEGDVIPDPVMCERRRRVTEADLRLAQARAVLRSVQAELEAGVA